MHGRLGEANDIHPSVIHKVYEHVVIFGALQHLACLGSAIGGGDHRFTASENCNEVGRNHILAAVIDLQADQN